MRLPKPKFEHPPEVYQAIIHEHQENPVRMGEVLMACGWTIGDAAWAAANWDLRTLAAAVAHERVRRKLRSTSLSENAVAGLKKQIQVETKAVTPLRPKRTTRIVGDSLRTKLQAPNNAGSSPT